MIRILAKLFHLDVGMRAVVTIFDSEKLEFMGEWDIEIENYQILKHRPKQPHQKLPPICGNKAVMDEVNSILRVYLDGYNHKSETFKWIKEIPDDEKCPYCGNSFYSNQSKHTTCGA